MAGDILGQLLGAALNGGSVRGAGANAGGGGGLGDLLGQVLGGLQQGGPGQAAAPQGGIAGSLGDILGQVLAGSGKPGQAGGAPGGLPGGLGDILGQVLGGGAPGGGGPGTGGAQGGAAGGLQGGLGDILSQILGGGPAGAGASTGGAGGSLGDLAGAALGGAPTTPAPAPASLPQGTSPAPVPTSADGTQPSGGADLMKYGGIAVIGMLAFNAFRKWQQQSGQGAGITTSGFHPASAPGGAAAFSQVLANAMAAAAQSDGKLDQDEVNRVAAGLQKFGAGNLDQAALVQFLSTPVDPQSVVNAATTPEAALQIYAASVMAVRPDSQAEIQYLANLAQALGIDPQLKAQVERDLLAA